MIYSGYFSEKMDIFGGMKAKYKRILLKLSGESLMNDRERGISSERLQQQAGEVRQAVEIGTEVAIVIGGGNIFRGRECKNVGIQRVQGDYMGMLATIINAMALQATLEQMGLHTRVMSGFKVEQVCEPFVRRRAIRHLEKGRVVIFAAGIGNPYFTTDSTASLRAVEIHADIILKGTKVGGVYSADPVVYPDAKHFSRITFEEVYRKSLQVMDMTAFTLCQENKLPIIVFNINVPGNLSAILQGEEIGTLIS